MNRLSPEKSMGVEIGVGYLIRDYLVLVLGLSEYEDIDMMETSLFDNCTLAKKYGMDITELFYYELFKFGLFFRDSKELDTAISHFIGTFTYSKKYFGADFGVDINFEDFADRLKEYTNIMKDGDEKGLAILSLAMTFLSNVSGKDFTSIESLKFSLGFFFRFEYYKLITDYTK